jgi:hypothetical protein
MPKVGVNNEPLLERLIFGYDGADYRVVKVDTSGNLVAAILAGQSIEVTQDTAADLKATVSLAADQDVQARGYGWVSAAWQKNPLLIGYSGTGSEEVKNLSAAAGTNQLNGTAVPAGEIWNVYAAHLLDIDSATTFPRIGVTVSGIDVYMISAATLAAGVYFTWNGSVILSPGDKVFGVLNNCTLNDDLYLRYAYVRIDIDQ